MIGGFGAKLRAFLDARSALHPPLIPSTVQELASYLTALGRPIWKQQVHKWIEGSRAPRAEFIGALEVLMGAPWFYLESETTPWPPATKSVSELWRLGLQMSAAEIRTATRALERALGSASRSPARGRSRNAPRPSHKP